MELEEKQCYEVIYSTLKQTLWRMVYITSTTDIMIDIYVNAKRTTS